ncbi:WYL domain-containing protein [Alteromonas sp. C1M14]|uniref:helix-turn-helix transcriptional regulator n=1 Tax=Alteromonas sp. C1M14 TaxID=2841567 RepID=UPI001C086331|nr:WYL domain-containing protein [Alteromonas sp. C1M14]MBU2979712.1 WYL domain-containing protein [Alteromonas sp. C1M14]
MKWPYRYDLLQRYRLIEIVAIWEGKLNAGHLIDHFGIGRQQASKDINNYLNEIAPGNLVYNSSLKGYEPSSDFKPVVTSCVVDEYLQLVQRNSDLTSTFESLVLGFNHTTRVPLPSFQIKPEVIRPIVKACRLGERLEVDYRSVNSPNKDGRIIVPHSIVHSGMRWHVRAYCEKNQEFRDFVLTRFFEIPESAGTATISPESDDSWHTKVNVCFKPDPRLSPAQQEVVANDYGMKEGILVIKVRAALVHYLLQMMKIDPNILQGKPTAQQIVIDNLEAIEKWLFK